MIPDDIVEEVRARADLVEVVGEHVRLKRSGKDFKALCPFHQEKTPSFYVVPAKGFYNCFGCGASGDVFSFLMEHVGLDFQEAVRQLARRVGVEIPERGERSGPDPHQTVREAVAFAADHYTRNLGDDEIGAPARAYLERRGIPADAAERFQLGYAPDAWRGLRQAAQTHGFDDDDLLEAGLIKESDRADEPYDRLRDRLVFPITDRRGRVIAFGGRLLGDGVGPKYLNSPETPIYHKGDVLYGLSWSKNAIRRADSALVVEGYMDLVSLAARGIEHVVAPLGTAMTPEQAQLLARYTKRALLLYDSDAAGLRATFKSGDALLGAGVQPLVVTLPEGEDPDSVVRAGGADALVGYLDDAVDVLDRKLQILERRGYLDDADKLRKALDGLLPTLTATTDAALRDIYMARVAERTGVRRETLEKEIENARAAAKARARRGRGSGRGSGRRAEEGGRRRGGVATPGSRNRGKARDRSARELSRVRDRLAAQRKLVLLLLRDQDRIGEAAGEIQPDLLTNPIYRELYEIIVRSGGVERSEVASLDVSDAARTELQELWDDPEELFDGDRIFHDLIRKLQTQPIEHRESLKRQIREAQKRGDDHAVESLMRELTSLKHNLVEKGYVSGWGINVGGNRSE